MDFIPRVQCARAEEDICLPVDDWARTEILEARKLFCAAFPRYTLSLVFAGLGYGFEAFVAFDGRIHQDCLQQIS